MHLLRYPRQLRPDCSFCSFVSRSTAASTSTSTSTSTSPGGKIGRKSILENSVILKESRKPFQNEETLPLGDQKREFIPIDSREDDPPWLFNRAPIGWWKDPAHQRLYLDWLGERLGYKSREDWYKISEFQVANNYGRGVLARYGGSAVRLVMAVYSDYDYLPWKFNIVPKGMASDPEYVKRVLKEVEKRFNIQTMDDWYRVSQRQLARHSFCDILARKHGTLYVTLKKYRPDFNWDETKFVGVAFSGKYLLGAYLRKLFPGFEILERAKLSDSSPIKNDKVYGLNWSPGKSAVKLKVDEEKVDVAEKRGVILIFVPFWWDRSIESLISTLPKDRLGLDINELLKNANIEGGADPSKMSPIPSETFVTLSSWKKLKGR